MSKLKASIVAITLAALLVNGCKKDINPDAPTTAISFVRPENWPEPIYTFQNNPLTNDGFDLGRKLFYDNSLSRDYTTSCGSCHQQFAAFAHLDHPLSHGIYGLFGTRNAPTLFNLAWSPNLMWDGGVINLENQPINPITNPVEMDMTLQEVLRRLNNDADYVTRFRKVFGGDSINSQQLFKALALFMGAMVSANSRYDTYWRTGNEAIFTSGELRGLGVFREHCASCHQEPLLTDHSFRNNGLMPNASAPDSGRAHVTGLPTDNYKFKVPSLRNIALSRPYMHDGRFRTLGDVVEHYRKGITASPTLDPSLNGGITMTDEEKANLLLFLNTLTDSSFVADPRFSEPR